MVTLGSCPVVAVPVTLQRWKRAVQVRAQWDSRRRLYGGGRHVDSGQRIRFRPREPGHNSLSVALLPATRDVLLDPYLVVTRLV